MTLNHDRLRKQIEDIARAVERLRRLQSIDKADFLKDEDSQDIARSRLLTAIEASLNICYHITAKRLNQVPESYAECFQLMGQNGLINSELAKRLALMAQFRNRLVHLYWDIDYGRVHDILRQDLDDLKQFAEAAAVLL